MVYRIYDLPNEINAIIDDISNYCNQKGIEIKVKEITFAQDFLPSEHELMQNPNARREEGVAKFRSSSSTILLSPLSSQMIWYIAWLAYRIKIINDVENTEYIIQQLIAVDKGEDNAPLNQFPDWNSNELNDIFCYAMGFLICHELGHAVHEHPTPYDENGDLRDTEMLKANEMEADSFATECILEISENKELAKYGILVAQLALLFIRNKDVNYDTHPHPDRRLENIGQYFVFTGRMPEFIDKARELSQVYLENRFVH